MSTPEGRIKAKFKRRLKPLVDAQKVFCLMPVQTRFGRVGLDFHLIVHGRAYCVEAKKDAKTALTARQTTTADHIRKSGGAVRVIYDDASVDAIIKEICWLVYDASLTDVWSMLA